MDQQLNLEVNQINVSCLDQKKLKWPAADQHVFCLCGNLMADCFDPPYMDLVMSKFKDQVNYGATSTNWTLTSATFMTKPLSNLPEMLNLTPKVFKSLIFCVQWTLLRPFISSFDKVSKWNHTSEWKVSKCFEENPNCDCSVWRASRSLVPARLSWLNKRTQKRQPHSKGAKWVSEEISHILVCDQSASGPDNLELTSAILETTLQENRLDPDLIIQ